MRKVLAALLAIVFVLLFPVGLAALAVETVLLDPGFYKNLLAESDVYGKSYSMLISSVGNSPRFSRDLPLSSDEVEQLVRDIAPRDFLRRQTELAIDEGFAWLYSTDPTLRITVPLTEVKARIPSALAAAVDRRLAQLPPCIEGTPPRLDEFPQCIPAGMNPNTLKAAAAPELQRVGREMAAGLPDSISFSEILNKAGGQGTDAQNALISLRQLVAAFKSTSPILYAAIALLLLLIGLLTYGPLRSTFSWIGVLLLVCGLTTLAGALLVQLGGLTLLDEVIAAEFGREPDPVTTIGIPVLRSWILGFLTRMYVESGIAAGVGLVLLISRRFLS